MCKIVVVGSLNMDMVVSTDRVPEMGETILGKGFFTSPGGKGANQAVTAARLGGQVSMVGCVGNDTFGRALTQNLQKNNVSTNHVKTIDDVSTGVAIIVIKDGNNFIIVEPGANYKLTPEIVESVEDEIAKCSIMMIQLEVPLKTVEAAVKIAKRHGVKVLLNPAPAVQLPEEIINNVDIITPNETEAGILTGVALNNKDDAKSAVRILLDKGINKVVITLGSQGAMYNSGNDIKTHPAVNVKVVDTTAAGDSFCGALAVALSHHKTIDEAVEYANAVGTLTITKKGAQSSLPTKADVERFMKAIHN